ncbi:hypothetical protein CSA56_05375 [candidate division KSB3 bacterium]|uniref:DUF3782 domain-containing protein n=1 Tax=candidate division KSB3 bacterium TaxID=2044937 RepID=A0A2G6KJD0_9BACT|nr:MAG: hypothetical protein CSA56_05375 [candidate division KSB3 bacterium]
MDQATVQEIKGFFQEIRDLYRETDLRMKETDLRMKETDRQMKETDRQMKETDRRLDRMSQETDRQMKETDRKIRAVNKQIGELTGRLGQFVEEMVKPGVEKLFQERGIDVTMTTSGVSASDHEGGIEIDIMVRNGKEIVLIECKSKLRRDDVNEHLERLAKFKRYFPEYADKQVMGAVAAMVIPEGVGRYASKKGLFVMAQHGEFMVILNDDQFEPKTF